MNRRTYLKISGATLTAGLAGCVNPTYSGKAANEFGYETTEQANVDVPLVPIADAYEWYRSESAVFVDARSERAYEAARIEGAIHSEAPEGNDRNDPVGEYSTDTRIVTYCGCPHHLSTLRGAALIGNGYAHTYALDEGFVAWEENSYPMEGVDVQADPEEYRIEGRTDPEYAGNSAWAWHDASGQREATEIENDGRFSLLLRFYDLQLDSRIRITTPDNELVGVLRALTDGEVRL